MTLHLITYISRAVNPLSHDAVQDIADVAAERNARESITGMLLFGQGHFIQVLEGPPDGVRAVYASIRRDERHTDVQTLLDAPIRSRLFPRWSMGLVNIEARGAFDAERIHFAAQQLQPLYSAMTPNASAVRLLRIFNERARAA